MSPEGTSDERDAIDANGGDIGKRRSAGPVAEAATAPPHIHFAASF